MSGNGVHSVFFFFDLLVLMSSIKDENGKKVNVSQLL